MMVFVSDENENKDEPEEEEADDSEASIDDGVLDELGDDKVADEADTEGFGHIDEDEVEEEPEEEGELEDDAEDVDFDSFDDVDEL